VLIRLSIKDFAIVEDATFEPREGLNIITGETGAGKSLVIDAIGALLGSRISKDYVRRGQSKAVIEAVFDHVSDVISEATQQEYGLSFDDGMLILSREILAEGRSLVRINGRTMPVSLLKLFGPFLIDIHGQHDQQAIFDANTHLGLLDDYCGEEIQSLIYSYGQSLHSYKACLNERKTYETDQTKMKQLEELLSFQIDEISSANFREGDDIKLKDAFRSLSLAEKRKEHLSYVLSAFSSIDDQSAISMLHTASSHLEALAAITPSYMEKSEALKSLCLDLNALGDELTEVDEEDGESLEEVENRLDLLNRCLSKYGGSISAMNLYLEEAKLRLDRLVNSKERLAELDKERVVLEKELLRKAELLHEARRKYAKSLSSHICDELRDLGLPYARFEVQFFDRPKERYFGKRGTDDIAFMFSANSGEELKPLAKTASGGEASRIMLAIKSILARADITQTLIFDEIDAGISGEASKVVSEKMKTLSKYHQVICVTHMGQIAAAADEHFFISKEQTDSNTRTMVTELSADGRIGEVARLLSGNANDASSRALAQELIKARSK